MSQLSDQELIQLVQEKLPEELSETELDQLRERLRVSAELRDTLIEQLHFEAYLNEALGKFEVSIDEIVAVGVPQKNRISGYWGWTAVILIGLLGSVLVMVAVQPEKPQAKLEAADKEALKKLEEELAAKKKADAEKVVESTKPEKVDPKLPTAVVATPVKPGDPAATKPVQPPIDPALLWRKEFEAENYARGNIKIDTKNMGTGIGVIYADDAKPVFAEYDVTIPQAGKYRVDLRYAAKVQRPLKLLVNGQPALNGIARSTTKDWKPQAQGWFPAGEIDLPAGAVVVRLV